MEKALVNSFLGAKFPFYKANMLIAFSIFFIPAACVLAIILRMRGRRLAYVWLLLFSSVAATLVFLLFLNPLTAKEFSISNYYQFGSNQVDLIFKLSPVNKLAGIGVLILSLAYLATETINPRGYQSLFQWVEVLLFTSAAWAILLAGNSWAVLVSWAFLDLLKFISQLVFKQMEDKRLLPFYLSKVLGLMMLVLITSFAYQSNPHYLLGEPISNIGIWVILAVFLHSGFYVPGLFIKAGAQTPKHIEIINIVVFISQFYLLSQIPAIRLSPIIQILMQIIFAIGAITLAIRWILKESRNEGMLGILQIFGLLAGFLLLSENQSGVIFLLLMLIPMSEIILAKARMRQLLPLWILALVSISGFPFTLQFAALEKMIIENQFIEIVLISIPTVLIAVSLFKILKRPAGSLENVEQLNKTVYILGISLPIIGVIMALWSYQPAFKPAYLWVGGLELILFFIFIRLHRIKKFRIDDSEKMPDKKPRLELLKKPALESYEMIMEFIGGGLSYSARILEEDGGILWAFVFLSLLLTVLASVGGLN